MEQKITGAEAVMKCLELEGVTTLFGYPGGAIMPIYDALYDYQDRIQHYLVRHEQGAIHAAQGYARSGGGTGVVFATSGPGATNLITGLADALIDSTPLVCITGQVASHLLGTDAFQETDVMGISMPVTKWNIQVTRPEEVASALARAFYIAKSGRPGPVLVDITKDAQFGLTDFDYTPCTSIRSYQPMPNLDKVVLEQVASLINSAHKPYLLIGQGILLSEAETALLRFVEKAGIPVASTLLGLGAFPADHANYVGYLGMHGNYAPNVLTNECDVLIAIGMRFDDRVTGDVNRYAKQAKIVHIDIDAAELHKIVTTEIAVHADAKQALEFLTEIIEKRSHSQWIQQFRELGQVEFNEVIANTISHDKEELNMACVIHQLSEWNKKHEDLIVVTDVGQHQMVTSRYFNYTASRSNITSGGLGTMGFALPAAIGASVANPQKTVVAIIGDGGFQMTIQELGTILQFGMAVKIIVLNNHFLGMVRQWQQLFFDRRYSFTEIVNPDFGAIVKGYSIPANKISAGNQLVKALEQLLTTPGSAFLECVVEREENVFPMVATGASVAEIRLN